MIIGLHWPSLAWGEEELGGGEGSFAFSSPQTDPLEKMVAEYAQRLDATPEMRDALRVILRAAAQEIAPEELPAEVHDAYRLLDSQSSSRAKAKGRILAPTVSHSIPIKFTKRHRRKSVSAVSILVGSWRRCARSRFGR